MKKRRKLKELEGHPAGPTDPVASMTDFSSDMTDPQGSYTGCPENLLEKPVQDVDDL